MKSFSKKTLIPALAAAALAVAFGCKNRLPLDKAYPGGGKDYTTIIDFEHSDQVNPNLLGAQGNAGASKILWGGGGLEASGGVTQDLVKQHFPLIVPIPASMPDGTPTGCHVYEVFQDLGNAIYPSNQLRVKPTALGYFDASPFSGIKFLLNIQSGDDALKRRFSIGVAQTLPTGDPDGGATCDNSNNGCNNNFGAMLSNTNGSWTTESYLFSDLTRESFGNPTTPSTFSGINLKQVIRLVWEEGRNNSAGTCHVDYWLDQVEFF